MVKLCSMVLALARHLFSAMQSTHLDLHKRIASWPGKNQWVQYLPTIVRLCTAPPGPVDTVAIRDIPITSRVEMHMRAADAVLQIKVPRNKTVLMQHLQLLVFRGHYWWCSGSIEVAKLGGFAAKMAVRYPVTRSARGRAYDRTRGLAAMHLIVYPLANGQVAWWLLSDSGKGGLNDPASSDAHVAKHAMAANGHIAFTDYVLHYAHKKSPRSLPDKKTGGNKIVLKSVSTWTWKLTDSAYNETKASIEQAAVNFQYGAEGANGARPWGILGILVCQRSRPLFSGVRTHVLDLHRYADSQWGRVKKKWQGQHSGLCLVHGSTVGELRSLKDVMNHHLPKMVRIAVYGENPGTIGDLIRVP